MNEICLLVSFRSSSTDCIQRKAMITIVSLPILQIFHKRLTLNELMIEFEKRLHKSLRDLKLCLVL